MQSAEVEMLRAQGLDAEADALVRSIEQERRLAEARALGSDELEAFLHQLFEVQDAAREAADAAREAAEAAAEEARARDDLLRARQVELDLIAREALLRGDEAVAFEARARARAEAEMARAQELLEAGKISEEAFVRVIAVIEGELDQALGGYIDRMEEQAQAARDAAEAEAMRQAQDMQNLELRLLRAQGMDEEAHQLRALMQLEEARREGRDAEYIAMLEQIHAADALTRAREREARAAAEAERAAREAERAMRTGTSGASGNRVFSGTRATPGRDRTSIVQVSGDNTLFALLDTSRAIERNTQPLLRMQGLGSSGGINVTFNLTQRAGEDMEGFANRVADSFRDLDERWERERRRGERDRGSGRAS